MKKFLLIILSVLLLTGCLCSCRSQETLPQQNNNENKYENVQVIVLSRTYQKTLEKVVNDWIKQNNNKTIVEIVFINAYTGWGDYSEYAELQAIIIYKI